MLQFKVFFNEWYLRDCSKKVKNGKKTRANEGKVMVTYATYGYKKDPLDKNHYELMKNIDRTGLVQLVNRIIRWCYE